MRVRYAPTPVGHLFLGGARLALANFLHARRHDGYFLLRFDDLDRDRARPDFAEAIEQDLRWLGLTWDACMFQSERTALYDAAIARLKQTGQLYPCFESEEELRAKRDYRQKRGQPTVYDRAMLRLTPEQRAAAEASGKRPHWRFRLSDRTLAWHDMIQGPRQAKLPAVSDPILVRADGRSAPVLASVVDDIDTGITHVIRADDSAAHTAIQIELFEALGADPRLVTFAHLPPLPELGQSRLGRRAGSLTLRGLRSDGIVPQALASWLARAGAAADLPPTEIADLAGSFDLRRLSRTPPGLDVEALLTLNRQVLVRLEFAAVADRLPAGATEAFWLAVRDGLDLLKEARGWWDVVTGTIVPPVMEDEHELLSGAEALLPPEPWDSAIWQTWTDMLAAETGRDGREVQETLRLALTGEDHGPDLANLLPLIGRHRTANRLRTAAA
ncbi:MAG: glutamate--tRNA ligase [Acetobacteraceae bacterium]